MNVRAAGALVDLAHELPAVEAAGGRAVVLVVAALEAEREGDPPGVGRLRREARLQRAFGAAEVPAIAALEADRFGLDGGGSGESEGDREQSNQRVAHETTSGPLAESSTRTPPPASGASSRLVVALRIDFPVGYAAPTRSAR